MKRVTSHWLEETNEEFKKNGITDGEKKIRLAIAKWRKENVDKMLEEENVDLEKIRQHLEIQDAKIQSFFLTQRERDRGYIHPPFVGIFYFYGNFWEITIPFTLGAVGIHLFDCLKMPNELKHSLAIDEDAIGEYNSVWADSYDYAYGILEFEYSPISDFSKELFRSADKHLRASISLLNQEKVSSKAIEDARMSVEIFSKAYLAAKDNLTDSDLRRQIGHNLETAIDRCIAKGLNELTYVKDRLHIFPEVQSRYEAPERSLGELWTAYRLAHITGTTILRDLTGRDTRKFIKIIKIPSGNYLSFQKYIQFNIGSQYSLSAIVFPENFRDVHLDISSEKLDEIINSAVSDKISGLDVLSIGEIIFGTYGTKVFLGQHITLSLEFKSYENFINSINKSSGKSFKELDFYTNQFGYTEILELTDGLEIKIYIEKKYIPEWR
jgi:hypothetical protein